MSTPIGSSQWMYASGEAVTQQSLKFNDDESQYLSWTPAAAGNRKTFTWSGWVKRGNLGINTGIFQQRNDADVSQQFLISFRSGDNLRLLDQPGTGGNSMLLDTSAVFRDTSAWYHIVVAIDTTNGTAADRAKLYVNGERITSFASTTNYSTQNYDTSVNNTVRALIGVQRPNTSATLNSYFDGYLSDIHLIDGQALDPTSFGETVDGYWKAKDYAGTYGTNGFHLTFQDDVVSEGFNAVTYTGTGTSSGNVISGLGLNPDLVWIKRRNAGDHHMLYDSVRHPSNPKQALSSSLNYAESSITGDDLDFVSDGFEPKSSNAIINGSGSTYVAWCWDAGSGSAASNTDGSITSSVKANPSYGFSIASFVGNGSTGSVGHGLNSKPELVITKDRQGAAFSWYVNTDIIDGSFDELYLNENLAKYDRGTFSFTSTTFPYFLGASNTTIAYCFHSVANYSSIGSYTGTGAAGNAVTTGFRPAFIMIKKTDSASDWWIFDTTRDTNNQIDSVLYANLANAEFTDTTGIFDFEITSNGFVNNSTNSTVNGSGASYIYMAFADTREAAFWKDVSGQGNHWQPNNLDYRDSLIDSPANNFATLNPLFTNGGSTQNFKEGNLQFTADGNYALAHGTFAMRTGKWYWETYIKSWVSVPAVGISRGTNTGGNSYVGYDPNGNVKSFGYESGGIIYGASGIGTSAGSQLASGQTTYTTGDVIGCSFDADVGELKFYKNGTLIYTVSSIDEFDWMPATSAYNGGINIANFGQDSTFSGARPAGGNTDDNGIGDFKYAPPSGYLALCTANLPEPTIIDGSEHFDTALWTADVVNPSAGDKSISLNFQPDLVWSKNRDNAEHHYWMDSVRGDNDGSKWLKSNATAAEGADAIGSTTAKYDFTATGFDIIDTDSTSGEVYYSSTSRTYVGWNWKAGGTAVSNTDGSITSQVSANVDAGFSIATYTGTGANASFGHGLGVAPDMVLVKRRDSTNGWIVFHKDLTTGHILILDSTTTSFFSNQFSPDPSSSVVSIKDQPATNASGGTYVAYSFANTDGYCKAGSYIGNGSSDGPFVYTGFRPAWVMHKTVDTTANQWSIRDNKRDIDNEVLLALYANLNIADDTGGDAIAIDFLSNGFKPRRTNSQVNQNGTKYIYLAFAETPFKYANAR